MTNHVTSAITWPDRMYLSAQVYLLRLTGTTVGHSSGILFSHVCPDLFWSYNFICCLREVFYSSFWGALWHTFLCISCIYLFIHLLTFHRSWRGQSLTNGGKNHDDTSASDYSVKSTLKVKQECLCGELWNKVGSYLLICTVCLCDLIVTTSVNFVPPCDPGSLKSPCHVRP